MSRSGFQVGEVYGIAGRQFTILAVRPDPESSNFDLVDYRFLDDGDGTDGWLADTNENQNYHMTQYVINEVPHLLDEMQEQL